MMSFINKRLSIAAAPPGWKGWVKASFWKFNTRIINTWNDFCDENRIVVWNMRIVNSPSNGESQTRAPPLQDYFFEFPSLFHHWTVDGHRHWHWYWHGHRNWNRLNNWFGWSRLDFHDPILRDDRGGRKGGHKRGQAGSPERTFPNFPSKERSLDERAEQDERSSVLYFRSLPGCHGNGLGRF